MDGIPVYKQNERIVLSTALLLRLCSLRVLLAGDIMFDCYWFGNVNRVLS